MILTFLRREGNTLVYEELLPYTPVTDAIWVVWEWASEVAWKPHFS